MIRVVVSALENMELRIIPDILTSEGYRRSSERLYLQLIIIFVMINPIWNVERIEFLVNHQNTLSSNNHA